MKKIIHLIFLFLFSTFSIFATEKVSIFIDISGSVNSTLPEIQQYVTEEYIPKLKPDSNVEIYKFYGKLRIPPIYKGNLDTETKIRWAKHQVNALIANGPWTNISQVLDYIKTNCLNYGDTFIIFTDGKQELEDSSDNYELTDDMVKSILGKNAVLVQKGNWKTVEFTYQKEIPFVEKVKIIEPEGEKSKNFEAITITEEKHHSETKTKFWKWIILGFSGAMGIVLIILILILLSKRESEYGSSHREIKLEVKNQYFVNNVSDMKIEAKKLDKSDLNGKLNISDLSENKQNRLQKEKEFEKEILAEAELNRRIANENQDYITTPDGSYSNYYNQKIKICVVGHEDRGLYGADYNDTLQEAYKEGKIGVNNGYESPNQLGVHRKTLKYTYGLQNDLEYDEIPNANELGKKLGTDEGHSFAFVNESKASNLRDDSQILNRPQYDDFVDRNAKKGYMKEQMNIMKPHLVIGQKMSQKTIDSLGEVKLLASENGTNLYQIKDSSGRIYRLINNKNHFSARAMSDKDEYEIIRKLYKTQ